MRLKRTKKKNKQSINLIFDSLLNNKYKIKKDNIKLFNLGKSGCKIGTYKYQGSEKIIKFVKFSKKDLTTKKKAECIYLHFFYNEIFINYILQNISKFITPKQYLEFRKKNYQNNLVKTIKYV